MENGKLDPSILISAGKWERTVNKAVHAAQEESRRLGVPNVYSINGHIYYELPDGTLSLDDPYVEPAKEKAADGE